MRVFMTSLVVAFVVLSARADNAATHHVVTGTVAELQAGEWMSVVNGATDPTGIQFTLRETTSYEGNRAAIKPGIRVTVWYRSVAERRPVADKVRVLIDATPR
jgi:hypothetical protein